MISRRLARAGALLALGCGLLAACAGGDPAATQDPVTEAYRLMDAGENGRAVILLRRVIEKDPANEEARFLLATAYMGDAGINIYSIHDSFQDVLFSKSLLQTFSGDGSEDGSADAQASLREPRHATRTEEVLIWLERHLNDVRRLAVFLERFPDVPREKWVLLDESLRILEGNYRDRDLVVYRALVRVIYIRAFLRQEIIRNPDFGTRAWACGLDLSRLRDGAEWLASNLSATVADVRLALPERAASLRGLHLRFQKAAAALRDLEARADAASGRGVPGQSTGLIYLQDELKDRFDCHEELEGGKGPDEAEAVETPDPETSGAEAVL